MTLAGLKNIVRYAGNFVKQIASWFASCQLGFLTCYVRFDYYLFPVISERNAVGPNTGVSVNSLSHYVLFILCLNRFIMLRLPCLSVVLLACSTSMAFC